MSLRISSRSLLPMVLTIGASLAVTQTAATVTQWTATDPITRSTISFLVFGALYAALLWRFLPQARSLVWMMTAGALAFGTAHQLIVLIFGFLFDGYALFPLSWPWSTLLAFGLFGGLSNGFLARLSGQRGIGVGLSIGGLLTFGIGQGVDLAVRNIVFPRLMLSPVTLSVALTLHIVANFCCGLIIGIGLWCVLRESRLRALTLGKKS